MPIGDYPNEIYHLEIRRYLTAPPGTALPSFIKEIVKLPNQRISSIVGVPAGVASSIGQEPLNKEKDVRDELERLRQRVLELESRERCAKLEVCDDSDTDNKRAISFEDEGI